MTFIKQVGASILALIILCGVAFGIGYAVTGTPDITNWGKQDTKPPIEGNTDGDNNPDNSGDEEDNKNWDYDISGGEAVLSVNSFVVSSPVVDEEPIFKLAVASSLDSVEQAESSVTIVAKLTPAVGSINWSIAFKNPQSAWAKGKVATDYINLTSALTGSNSCRADCLQPFGEQIIITAAIAENPNVTATCTADYKERITEISSVSMKTTVNGTEYDLVKNQAYFNEGKMPDFETSFIFTKSIGTIPLIAEEADLKLYVKIGESFYSYFNGYLKNNPNTTGEVGAKDWTLIDGAHYDNLNDFNMDYSVEYHYDNKLSYHSINSGYLYSKLYDAMLNKVTGELNSNVNIFLSGARGCANMNGGLQNAVNLFDLKFELTIDERTVVLEKSMFVNPDCFSADSITLDKNGVVFRG